MSDDQTQQAGANGPGTGKESGTYGAMLTELDGLVRDVAAPELDLDELVRKIERGYGLIKTMRGRLEDTKVRIEQLRLDLA